MIKEVTSLSRMEQIVNSDEYVTVLEAADILGISTSAVRHHIQRHNILAWKDCVKGHTHKLYIRKNSIQRWSSKPENNSIRFCDVTSESDLSLLKTDAYLTLEEAADILHISKRTVYNWISADIFTEVVRVWTGPNKFYYMLEAVECREIYRLFSNRAVRKKDILYFN